MAKPFTIAWPLKNRSAEDIDRMFRDLYARVEALEKAVGEAPLTAQSLTRTVVGQ